MSNTNSAPLFETAGTRVGVIDTAIQAFNATDWASMSLREKLTGLGDYRLRTSDLYVKDQVSGLNPEGAFILDSSQAEHDRILAGEAFVQDTSMNEWFYTTSQGDRFSAGHLAFALTVYAGKFEGLGGVVGITGSTYQMLKELGCDNWYKYRWTRYGEPSSLPSVELEYPVGENDVIGATRSLYYVRPELRKPKEAGVFIPLLVDPRIAVALAAMLDQIVGVDPIGDPALAYYIVKNVIRHRWHIASYHHRYPNLISEFLN